jgi:hypothetical protein
MSSRHGPLLASAFTQALQLAVVFTAIALWPLTPLANSTPEATRSPQPRGFLHPLTHGCTLTRGTG